MTALPEFLDRLLTHGEAALAARPRLDAVARPHALDRLADAHAAFALDLAGPPVPFDPDAALSAAVAVASACWFLVNHDDSPEAVAAALALPAPRSAAAHVSADLTLRFLPAVYRRARASGPSDALTRASLELLRRWPLSGVLGRLDEPPLVPPAFDHAGVQLLYAERYAARPAPGWEPAGDGAAWLELVRAEAGS